MGVDARRNASRRHLERGRYARYAVPSRLVQMRVRGVSCRFTTERIMTNHIMIDLETMGTGPTAAIIAIGAVKFGRGEIGDTFYRNVSLASSMSVGLKVDGDTVMWWLQQDTEAVQALLTDHVHIAVALMDFTNWCGADPVIWGNGAASDNVWLRSAYAACGHNQPWTFRDDRCYRTVRKQYPDVEVQRVGVAHNALDDAITQARHLIRIGAPL